MYKNFSAILFIALLCIICANPIHAKLNHKAKLSPYTFGQISPRYLGPAVTSGRITAIDAVDSNPNIIYVGTAGGGVWKSVDGGITFKPIFDKYTQSIGCLTINQKKPEQVWVGTGECNVRNSVSVGRGLYKTEDGGKNWKFMGFKDSERISKVVLDQNNPGTIYVAVLGHLWNANKERGVFKSTDYGKTWKKVLYVDENTGAADLDIDPQETKVLYASMWQFRRTPYSFTSGGPGSGLYKTTDGGKHWKKITKGLPKGKLGRIGLDISPSRPGTLYALVEAKNGGLFKSTDMGESWTKINDSMSVKMRPFYFSNIEVDPKDHNRLYVINLTFNYSDDGGKSFTNPIMINMGFSMSVHPDMHAMWINPNEPRMILIGTDGGVYLSRDRGAHFRFISDLPVSQFYHVSCDDEIPYHIYGGLQDNGSWMAPSKTFTSGVRNKDWKNVGGGDGFYVFKDPTDPDIVFSSWQGGELQWRNLKTGEERDIKPMPKKGEPKYRFNWNAAVALSPNNPNVIYIGAQFLFKSRDRGSSWQKISPDLTTNNPEKQKQEFSGGITPDDTTAENYCTIYTIAESPKNQSVIWVGTDDGNLQLTRDGGKHWTNVVKNIPELPPNTWCSCVEASPFDEATAYVTFDGHRTGDKKPYVYKTSDYGKTWKTLTTEQITGYCHVIRSDVVNPNLLFLGTEFGLYISLDGGQNWVHFNKNMPEVAVRDIAIQKRMSDLILATHGRGILVFDDITPLRHLTKEVIQSNVAMLPSRPSTQSVHGGIQDFPGSTDYVADNPPDGAVITYYLKKRHIIGGMKLEVLDKNEKIIQQLAPGQRKGINRVYWSMRLKPPKPVPSPGLSGRGFAIGPMVDEGVYTIRLIKNGKTYDGKITLIPDPLTHYTKKERIIRHKSIMKLYRMQAELAYIVDTLLNLKKQSEEKAKAVKEKKLKTKLDKFAKEIKDFYSSFIQTRGMFVEGKLRADLIGLYSSILSYGGAPTKNQLDHLNALKTKVENISKKFNTILKEKVPSINNSLKKANIPSLHYLTRKAYDEKEAKKGATSSTMYIPLFLNDLSLALSL